MLLINCPYCGHKLCKADIGTHINVQCTKCKEYVDIIVEKENIIVGKTKKSKAQ